MSYQNNKMLSVSGKGKHWSFALAILTFLQPACKKLVEIPPPPNTITTSEAFSDSANTVASIEGIYSSMINTSGSASIGSGAVTLYCGLSSDELINSDQNTETTQFYTNALQPQNNLSYYQFWYPAYQIIYQTNAAVEGIANSTGLSQSLKDRFTGEAKFIRAFLYFYLVNLYGDIPLTESTNFKSTSLSAKTKKDDVYKAIVSDLDDAKASLPVEYQNGERTRANKWAAAALLARVHLFRGEWADAETAATEVIGDVSDFNLVTDLNQVFLRKSTEAILQWNQNTSIQPFNATLEGYTIIPYDETYNPLYYMTAGLLNDFEANDQRRVAWVDSTNYNGDLYYFPYKYKVGPAESAPGADPTEYYTVLRLSEQYLIRSEARAQLNNISGAQDDLNMVRARASLGNTPANDKPSLLTAILKERRVELFAEWGHRWLDLKRTGAVDSVMTIACAQKGGTWQSYQQLYPIYLQELINDPNLKQNSGYN